MKNSALSHLNWFLACLTTMLVLLWAVNIVSEHKLKNSLTGVLDSKHYTSCEIALSLMIEQERSFSAALVPATLGSVFSQEPCDLVDQFFESKQHDIEFDRLRFRYIWGVRAIYGLALNFVNDRQLERVLTVCVLLFMAILACVLLKMDIRYGMATMPLIFGAALFSGLFEITAVPLAVSYFWAWLSPFLLIVSYKYSKATQFSLISGMVSAYLWFMDGHIVLSTALTAIVTFVCYDQAFNQSKKARFSAAITNVCMLHLGFVSTIAVFFVLKGVYFGFDSVFENYSSAIVYRSSNISAQGEEVSPMGLLIKLLFVGYQATAVYGSVLLWKSLLISTLVFGFFGTVCFFKKRVYLSHNDISFIIILMFVSLYCLLRLFLLPNHSFIHAYLVSRYLFIPLFCVWSFAVLCCTNNKYFKAN